MIVFLQIFEGNRNAFLTKKNPLKPLTARAFRIHPILVDKDVSPCGRLELYGCKPSEGMYIYIPRGGGGAPARHLILRDSKTVAFFSIVKPNA